MGAMCFPWASGGQAAKFQPGLSAMTDSQVTDSEATVAEATITEAPATEANGPLVEFFQLVSSSRPPRRADRSVGGVIPARALRYCEAITSASGFGWYVFLPLSFKVVWDGHDMLWTYPGVDEWLPLTRDAVQYPGFSQQFDESAPADVRGFCPPFLSPSLH